MEVQLFESLFRAPEVEGDPSSSGDSLSLPPKVKPKAKTSSEVVSIIESISNATGTLG
jgi:hypothetical protein